MNPIRPDGAATAVASPDIEEDPFAAATYSEWVRRAVRLRERRRDLSLLFESTTPEPTNLLADTVREVVQGDMPRFVSVFADGNPFARSALARRYRVDESGLLMTTGATSGIRLVLDALVAPGDEVLVEAPGFDVLERLAREAGAKTRPLPRRGPDFQLDVRQLQTLLTPRTRAVLVTSLHNPTGAALAADDIRAAAAALAPVGAVLIVDEVYADYAGPAVPAARLAPNAITISSLTKVFGLFALKFGWIVAAPALLDRIREREPDGDVGVSKLSHAVAARVLEHPAPFEEHWRRILASGRSALLPAVERLTAGGLIVGALPQHGCMYFPRIASAPDTMSLARRLFEEHGVLAAPGEYFGAPGYLRIGCAGSEPSITEGMTRLERGLLRLLG